MITASSNSWTVVEPSILFLSSHAKGIEMDISFAVY
jgi:hypothetical protein